MGATTQPSQRQEDWLPSVSLAFPPQREINFKMSNALCVVGSSSGSEGQEDCSSCYLIGMGPVMAIIASDILLTIFIIIAVFCFASQHQRRREQSSHDGKRNLPLSVSKKMSTEVTESPYQELHGVQSDVYSELRHFRK